MFGRCGALGDVVPPLLPTAGPGFPAPPAGLSPAARRQFLQGRTVAEDSGCAACHRIGAAGNDGPGPVLTGIGAQLSPAALRAVLVTPAAPMPSFRALKPAQLRPWSPSCRICGAGADPHVPGGKR